MFSVKLKALLPGEKIIFAQPTIGGDEMTDWRDEPLPT